MAFLFLLLSLSLIVAIILVLYSFSVAAVLATLFIADNASSLLQKSLSFWTTGADMPMPRTDFTGAAVHYWRI